MKIHIQQQHQAKIRETQKISQHNTTKHNTTQHNTSSESCPTLFQARKSFTPPHVDHLRPPKLNLATTQLRSNAIPEKFPVAWGPKDCVGGPEGRCCFRLQPLGFQNKRPSAGSFGSQIPWGTFKYHHRPVHKIFPIFHLIFITTNLIFPSFPYVFFGFTCCDQWHILVCTYTHFTFFLIAFLMLQTRSTHVQCSCAFCPCGWSLLGHSRPRARLSQRWS